MTVKKAPPTSPAAPSTSEVRAQGLQLITALNAKIVGMKVLTPTQYLDADEFLGQVRNARSRWKSLLDPITAPIARMKADVKLAEQGAKNLNSEVDGPLESLELRIKEAMRQFKLEEQRQLKAGQDEKDREERERQLEIQKAREKEEAARTAPMKAKLAEARARLEAEQAQSTMPDMNPQVKGASSAARTVSKPKITDLIALIAAMDDYEPKAGIYQMGVPPLSLIAIEMLQTAINKIYRDQPGVVASWPGIVVEDDVIIAGR